MPKTILCYGDSNTWGFIPCQENYQTHCILRYSREVRWPGYLQRLLGDEYQVIEEGLNGRTTNLDHPLPPNRNGAQYLPPCLYSHAPIDLVIVALGGNDLKSCFNRTAEDVKNGLSVLIQIINSSWYGANMQSPPKILILTQPIPLDIAEKQVDENGELVFKNIIAKARALIPLYEQLARETNSDFLDISLDLKPSSFDGAHFDEKTHADCAKLVHKKILKIFS